MTRPTIDVKILALPGVAQEKTAKAVWSAVAKAQPRVAVEQLLTHQDHALFGSPALPAVLVNGHVVHEGSAPSAALLKAHLK